MNYRIYILCASLVLGLATASTAQTLRPVTVELKNGRFLRGEMAVTVREDYLTLRQADRPPTHISYRKIRGLTFGTESPTDPAPPRFLRQAKRFFHLGEINVLAGSRRYAPNTAVGVHTVNGYHFYPHLGVGLGVGLDHYGSLSALPVYASVRGAVLTGKVSPYYFVNLGVSPAWGREPDEFVTDLEVRGGGMLHTGLGYQINLARSALLIHVGFKAQQTATSYRETLWGSEATVEEKRVIRRMSLGVGLML